MARSSKGSSFVLPLAIVATAVAAILVGVFTIRGEAPPDEATIISEDINAEPAGAGTAAEAPADPEEDGVTDQLDEVEPAAEGEDTIPAAANQLEADTGEDGAGNATGEEDGADEGETPAADASDQDDAATLSGDGSEEYLLDEDSDAPEGAEVDRAAEETGAQLPEGRDAQTELTTSECQDVVDDTDAGGAAFVPTPSGPNGNIGECVQSAQ